MKGGAIILRSEQQLDGSADFGLLSRAVVICVVIQHDLSDNGRQGPKEPQLVGKQPNYRRRF